MQENAAGNWEWPVQDGLGSVRGMAADALSVLESRMYAPYGEPFGTTGTHQTAFGFTGEQTDDNNLVYLRARYYNPLMEAFISLDPIESYNLNGYQYARSHPVQYVDNSGLFPTWTDVNQGGAEFSWNCGWIDWKHVDKSDEISYEIIDDTNYILQKFETALEVMPDKMPDFPIKHDIAGIPITFPFPISFLERIPFISLLAVVSRDRLNETNVIPISVSIFMEANEALEETQGMIGESSYYSEEDLTSDIIGFYIARERFKNRRITSSDIKNEVRKMCRVVEHDTSMEIYKKVYAGGGAGITGWKHWHPRFGLLTGCGPLKDFLAFTWPCQFSSLTSMRIASQPDGVWWWYRSVDGMAINVDVNQPRVLGFRDWPRTHPEPPRLITPTPEP